MNIDSAYLEMPFDKAGVRNSLKRLQQMIDEIAVEPVKLYEDDLRSDFELVEEIVLKRVAQAIAYWCLHKHDPVKPTLNDKMSDLTNARRHDETIADFYETQVEDAMHRLAPTFQFDVPMDYVVSTDELEFALLELEERFENEGITPTNIEDRFNAAATPHADDPDYEF